MAAGVVIRTAVRVTAADVALGERRQCHSCPVALALARVTGEPWVVLAGSARRVYGPPDRRFALPAAATAWIVRFDAGGAVGPLAFEFVYDAAA